MNDTDLSVVFNMLNNFLQLPQFLKYLRRKYEVNSNELTNDCFAVPVLGRYLSLTISGPTYRGPTYLAFSWSP